MPPLRSDGTNSRIRRLFAPLSTRSAGPGLGLCLALSLGLGGCAVVDQAAMTVASSRVPALVVIDTQVYTGSAVLYTDRTGVLKVDARPRNGPALECSGKLRYTSSRAGSLRLSCNDGTQAELTYVELTGTSGFGRLRQPDRVISFTLGLSADEAQGWLWAPEGKRVLARGSSVAVE